MINNAYLSKLSVSFLKFKVLYSTLPLDFMLKESNQTQMFQQQ